MQPQLNRPLWQQLTDCWQILRQYAKGRSISPLLATLPAPNRPGVQALVYAVIRNWGRAQQLERFLISKKTAPELVILLRLGLSLLSQDSTENSYSDFTLVNQLVEVAKKNTSTKHASGFLNACLRKYLRDRQQLAAKLQHNLVARWNHPLWWIEMLQRDYPNNWQAILANNLTKPPLFLRLNRNKTTAVEYLELLKQQGIAAEIITPWTLKLSQALPVQQLPNFSAGWLSVQDIAAQQAAPLLLQGDWLITDSLPRVLDACAAPGGKACHLLELAPLDLTMVEIDPTRADRIRENLIRLNWQPQLIEADVAQLEHWWDGKAYDAIVLDAPCSGSGVIRKHPDGLWLKQPADIEKLVVLQQKLLTILWQILKPGGRLLYCTCSIFKVEGELQIAHFLDQQQDADLIPSLGQLLPVTGPLNNKIDNLNIVDGDGFYYALLAKINN